MIYEGSVLHIYDYELGKTHGKMVVTWGFYGILPLAISLKSLEKKKITMLLMGKRTVNAKWPEGIIYTYTNCLFNIATDNFF